MDEPLLGLYVHLPWCVRKCPYCDFNSHRAPEALPVDRYVDALLADLAAQAPRVAGRSVSSVFFGGGTPSLFPPEAFARFLGDARGLVTITRDAEVTVEVNPGTVEHGPFPAYRAAGVNRVSLGVQSFDPAALARIGRIHGSAEARHAVEAALAAGFASVNVDLMFGLPGQDVAGAAADVALALALGVPHVSHYQLTIEPNTLFHARPPSLPDEETSWAMQTTCHRALDDAGYDQYEVSAWARPGHRCRHNMNYWSYGDYLGIGAGAHGKLTDPPRGTIRRTVRRRHPRAYLEDPSAFCEERDVDPAERLFEFALNAFRLKAGLPRVLAQARAGVPVDPTLPPWREAAGRGLLAIDDKSLRPTPLGFRYLNDLQALFLP